MVIRNLNLRDFPNPVFVETGSFHGKGITAARRAGFARIVSIELSPKYHAKCAELFAGDPRVEVMLGDSGELLPTVLASLDTPATLWLDGHWSGGDTARGAEPTPILRELTAVRPFDTILVDDVKCWSEWFDPAFNGGVRLDSIIAAIEAVGDFSIYTEGDVLVAVPR